MRIPRWLVLLAVAACSAAPRISPSVPPVERLASPPTTAKRPVVDTYHGVAITDDYQWLERGDDPEVRAWSDAQNSWTRGQLDAAPNREAITSRVRELLTKRSPGWYSLRWRAARLFALEDRPTTQQARLIVMTAPDPATSRVIVDPNQLDPSGGTTIDWYTPSLDGRLVAVSMSEGGTERGTVRIFDVESGAERTADAISYVQGGTAGGSLAWNADGTGFWHTRYPHPGERAAEDLDFYQQVWFYRLGGGASGDRPSLTEGLPRIAEIELDTSDDGRFVLATVANGDGGEYLDFLLDTRAKTPKWVRFADLVDKVVDARFGGDGALWLRSLNAAPNGKVLRLDPRTPSLAAAVTVVPASDVSIDFFQATATRLYVDDVIGGPHRVRVFDHHGRLLTQLPLHPVSSVWSMIRLAGDDLLYQNESFVEPSAWYRWDGKAQTSVKTALAVVPAARFDDAEVKRESCTSKDGTQVPISIVARRGAKLDGSNPVLLTGYGGYGFSLSPYFSSSLRVWLDHGGVYAVANLRGGGELGEAWHHAGYRNHKQNVFDDFIGCAHHLIAAGYTRPERLAIEGGSNGGLLMGAVVTQEPALVRAVVSEVGDYDMLRVELTPNGEFNVTEFGTVKNEADFRAIHAYSPYHHVKDGVSYPAMLFMTGENDPRVDPYHSRKMVARMQAANASRAPILLRTSSDTGHGMGTPLDAQIVEEVDRWSFLLWQLGVK